MMSDMAISTVGLTKYFGARPVVQQLDWQLPRGSITGLLGLNGAGKTTTLRMLMGLLEPTRGESYLLGTNSRELTAEDRARIGYTSEGHFLYRWMTVRECERFQRATFPRWNANCFAEAIQRFGIHPGQTARTLSRGQRAGVSMALTLATEPELLILDDPALGLDPVSRRALNETLLDFCGGGQRTVLLSSHLLDDIERVADRIAIMVDGRLLADTTLDDFLARVGVWSVQVPPGTKSLDFIPGLIHARTLGGRTIVTVADPDVDTESTLMRITGGAVEPLAVTFEDAVIAYLARSQEYRGTLAGAGA